MTSSAGSHHPATVDGSGLSPAASPAGGSMHFDDANLDYLRKHVLALQSVLIRKGIVTYAEVLQEVHRLEEVDHSPGARVVARAWRDPAYKARLLNDGKQPSPS
jgi:nitrile hydratase